MMDTLSYQGSRADLHVHSKYSDRPSEWFLRRIGAPESFVEPDVVYRTCQARGMDFVTITDHNSISGALKIADRPGVFLSMECTTYFPEDGCKIHCLVWGITEEQFRDIQDVRQNIYLLRTYLAEHDIAHAVAHPLFRINDRLQPAHVEKLLLLFKRFEGRNGARDPRADVLAQAIFQGLTPSLMAELATRHEIDPAGPDPHVKWLTGGSDDHSGLYIANAFTVTPDMPNVDSFLACLRQGRHGPAGTNGSSLRLAHGLIHIACGYYASRFAKDGVDHSFIGDLLRKISASRAPETKRPCSRGWRSILAEPIRRIVRRSRRRKMRPIERLILDEIETFSSGRSPGSKDREDAAHHFQVVSRLGHALAFRFVQRALENVSAGHVIEALESIGSLVPVLMATAPYMTAFGAQHKDEMFLRTLADHYPAAARLCRSPGRCAWVTDTFTEVNGVAHTIRTLSGMASRYGRDLTVVTSMPTPPITDAPLHNFAPVGQFDVPEYPELKLTLPPLLDMLHWFEQERIDKILISTPGPVGLCALAIGRLLGLPVKGIYHTDLPQYVSVLTEDDAMADLTRRYMRWFYGGLSAVFVPCEAYRKDLTALGLDPQRLRLLPRGVDRGRFHPGRRDKRFWEPYGRNGGIKYLYAGRISREKNIEVLIQAYCRLAEPDGASSLVLVGDGPAGDDFRRRYDRPDIVFTGYLHGDTLAAAMASADIFVFPSRTDTFGNAVLEAQACGLPAIVSEEGGPREIVAPRRSGLVVNTGCPEALENAMRLLAEDELLRTRLRARALERAQDYSWEDALERLYATDDGNASSPREQILNEAIKKGNPVC